MTGQSKNRDLIICSVSAYWTGGAVVSTLTISSCLAADSGHYSCSVPGGNLSAGLAITVTQAEHAEHLRPSSAPHPAGGTMSLLEIVESKLRAG